MWRVPRDERRELGHRPFIIAGVFPQVCFGVGQHVLKVFKLLRVIHFNLSLCLLFGDDFFDIHHQVAVLGRLDLQRCRRWWGVVFLIGIINDFGDGNAPDHDEYANNQADVR